MTSSPPVQDKDQDQELDNFAPIMSDWYETGSFCLLLTLLTVYPCLLVHAVHASGGVAGGWTGTGTGRLCPYPAAWGRDGTRGCHVPGVAAHGQCQWSQQ